jgi:CDP-diacylglycerol--glycerol-3-phosphate 3-phosphatidyltransferase
VSTPVVRAKRFNPDAVATPANFITVARLIFAVPTLILIADRGATWLTVSLWFVLSCTDGIDGWIARRDGTTRSGAFLDPLADKFLTIGGFVALLARGDIWWLPVALIAAREIGVSIYRSAAARRGISLPARQLGKWKAAVQMLAVGAYLLPPMEDMTELKLVVLWLAVAFTIISGLDIMRRGWRESTSAS